jgi:flagellar biosynthetic protein FliP
MNALEQATQSLMQSNLWENLAPPVQMALLMSSLVLLPAMLASLTCFTRVVIVLSFIRRGMATQEIPPNSVMIGLAMFLTLFVMTPTWDQISREAVIPYLQEETSGVQAIQKGFAVHKGFMLRHTRRSDLTLFLHMSNADLPQTPDDTPITALIPAYMISEMKTAFMMGFCIYIPFLLVDMVVATILMSMGMWMMPPVIISTPFKILLFVLADGWHLVCLSLNQSLT